MIGINKNKQFLLRCICLACMMATAALGMGCTADSFNKTMSLENMPLVPVPENHPVPGNGGIITALNITETSVSLSWTKATDAETPQESLEYRAFYSLTNNISTAEQALANGTPVGASWLTDVNFCNVTGLSGSSTYFFNILARDGEGNTSAYLTVSATTSGDVVFLFEAGRFQGNMVAAGASARDSLDQICQTEKDANYGALDCSTVRAFISVSSTDYIQNMRTNFSIPDRKIMSISGATIANSWADFMDGVIPLTLNSAGVIGSEWWSGYFTVATNSGAAAAAIDNCNGWTNGTNAYQGNSGAHNKTDSQWLSDKARNCNNSLYLLCLCW